VKSVDIIDKAEEIDEDVFFKKLVSFRFARQNLVFRVSQALFSSHHVDLGTSFLLKSLVSADYGPFQKILDLGCGYGSIGLSLKKVYTDSTVHMIDRDALAVEYSRQNATLNQLSGTKIYGSLGYDDITANDFDLIVSNIPGKAGESVISHLVLGAADYLRPDGLVAIVVVSALEETVEKLLTTTPNITVVFRARRSGHSVFHYKFTDNNSGKDISVTSTPDGGIYDRTQAIFSFHSLNYHIKAAWGLPEFDSRSYITKLLLEGIHGVRNHKTRHALIFNPGQGHAPVVLAGLLKPDRIMLIDRDLLSLSYSKMNLTINDYPANQIITSHQVGIAKSTDGKYDIIVGTLREDEGVNSSAVMLSQAAEQLSPRGILLISGNSTAITRLTGVIQKRKYLTIQERKRKKGYSLLVLKRGQI